MALAVASQGWLEIIHWLRVSVWRFWTKKTQLAIISAGKNDVLFRALFNGVFFQYCPYFRASIPVSHVGPVLEYATNKL